MVYICYELELSSCLEKSQSNGKENKKKKKLITKRPSDEGALDIMKLIKQQCGMHSGPFHPVYLRWLHSFQLVMEKRKYVTRGKYFFLSSPLWMSIKKYFFHMKLFYSMLHFTSH